MALMFNEIISSKTLSYIDELQNVTTEFINFIMYLCKFAVVLMQYVVKYS